MSDADAKFAQAKAYLMQCDENGQSVYEHLTGVVTALLEENPLDAAHHPERIAELSALIKAHQFTHGEKSAPSSSRPIVHHTQVERAEKNKKLFERPAPEVVTKIEQPTPFTTVTTTTIVPKKAPAIKSLVKESALWRFCGVGLNETECFLLDQSIAKLALQKSLEEVRFVGKIFGTRANYLVVSSKRYVAEGETLFEEVNTMPKPPRKKVDVDVQAEPGFKGCNRLSFWVAPHAAAEWTLLPDTTPQLINAARKIRKLFTGDLDAPIVAYPEFAGAERDYLRAQLSRIVSATFVSPANALERVEPEDEEEEDEEEAAKRGPKPAKYVPLARESKEYAPDEEAGVAALNDLEQWVHSEGYIYETGRQTKVPPKPEVEGEEEEEKEDEEEELDEKKEEEERELFQPIKKDSLFAVINIPKEPNPEEDGDDAEADGNGEGEGEGEEKEEEEEKVEEDEDIPDDDPLRKKLTAWTTHLTNVVYKKHGVAVIRSVRWPGAFAYAAEAGKRWGSVYFGNGLKVTDHAFTPVPAPPIQKEVDDLVEVMDATAATEKLVLRGEEPKENDSEEEKDDEEAEEDDQ